MHSRFTFFPFIILGFLLLLELYTWSGLSSSVIKELSVAPFVNGVFWGLMGLSLVSLIVVVFANRSMSKALRNFLFAFIFINLSSLLVFDVVLFIEDLTRGIRWIFMQEPILRSAWFIYPGLILSALPTLLFGLGMIIGPYRYRVLSADMQIENLPPAFEGFKIVQISDVHAGSFYNKNAVARGVGMINDLHPDAIFFTGDLVNDEASEIEPFMDLFASLKAEHGVFSILGNHDYGDYVMWPSKEMKAANLQRLKDLQREMGWDLLLNEHRYIQKGEDQLAIIGVENWGKGFGQKGDLTAAVDGCLAETKLLLSHDPTHWDEVVTKDFQDIDLTFSGHTHGAQMGIEWGKLRWSPIQLRYKKWAGRYVNGGQQLYINRGFGFLGYPGRLGIWPEITQITLVRR